MILRKLLKVVENENKKLLESIINKNFKFNGHKIISNKIFNMLK